MTSIHSSFPDRGQAGAPLLNNHETAGWRDAVGGHPLSCKSSLVSRAAYRPTGARGRAGALRYLPAHRLTYVGMI